MITDNSRVSIYNYLSDLFSSVSQNVYAMEVPTENTQDDTTNGFIVTKVGDMQDASEFDGDCYGWVRCFVTAYGIHVSIAHSHKRVNEHNAHHASGTRYKKAFAAQSFDVFDGQNALNIFPV